jgi:transcriptional regulator with XRE-family HTH domain
MLRLDPAVGIAIRIARKTAGLSQVKLARACSVTVRHIVAIEHGSNFNVDLLLAIARELPALRLPDVAAALLSTVADRAAADSGPRPENPATRPKLVR